MAKKNKKNADFNSADFGDIIFQDEETLLNCENIDNISDTFNISLENN
jgi:hypothetical protein